MKIPRSSRPRVRNRNNQTNQNQKAKTDNGGWVPEWVHTALDVAGQVPLVGNVADGLNAGLYASEGDLKNAAISAAGMIPGAGQAATGARLAVKAKKALGPARLASRMKQTPELAAQARKALAKNPKLQKEMDGLYEQLRNGNMNPGVGSKHLFDGVHEARSRGGARLYFRNTDNGVEILGKSSKANQQKVIDLLKQHYGK